MAGLSVLHVIPAVAPRYGGPSTAIRGLVAALEASGCSTTVATTDADGSGNLPVAHGRAVDYAGMRTIFFRRAFGEAFKWSYGLSAWLNRRVGDFDVVHVHAVFSHTSVAAARACRRAGVPYLVRPLGTLDPWSLARKSWRKRWLLRLGGRAMLHQAAAIHYTSAEEMRLAERAVGGMARGVVVPLGIDDSYFQPPARRSSSPEAFVLAMCRLDPKKGLDVLIDAFHRLIDRRPNAPWRLVLAGDGNAAFADALRQRAAAGPAGKRIEFAGWVSGGRKRELLGTARVFALPSRQENFGISVVEAMASGLPVVITADVNLASDVREAGAGWIVPREPDALAATLEHVLTDSADWEMRGSAARRFADRFRWPLVAEALCRTYASVVSPDVHASRTRIVAP